MRLHTPPDAEVSDWARSQFGEHYPSLPERVLEVLMARAETVVVAESCTGGGIGAALTTVPGSSAAFQGGVIAYSNALKMRLLGVPNEALESYGAVSEPVVSAMAQGAVKHLNAHWSIAVSGVAGPGGGSPEKPVGTVYFAVSSANHTQVKRFNFPPTVGRAAIQMLSVYAGLHLLSEALQN